MQTSGKHVLDYKFDVTWKAETSDFVVVHAIVSKEGAIDWLEKHGQIEAD